MPLPLSLRRFVRASLRWSNPGKGRKNRGLSQYFCGVLLSKRRPAGVPSSRFFSSNRAKVVGEEESAGSCKRMTVSSTTVWSLIVFVRRYGQLRPSKCGNELLRAQIAWGAASTCRLDSSRDAFSVAFARIFATHSWILSVFGR